MSQKTVLLRFLAKFFHKIFFKNCMIPYTWFLKKIFHYKNAKVRFLGQPIHKFCVIKNFYRRHTTIGFFSADNNTIFVEILELKNVFWPHVSLFVTSQYNLMKKADTIINYLFLMIHRISLSKMTYKKMLQKNDFKKFLQKCINHFTKTKITTDIFGFKNIYV